MASFTVVQHLCTFNIVIPLFISFCQMFGRLRTPLARPSCLAQSATFPSLHLRQSSFSNYSVALPTSQLILQPFHCFTYVTAHSPIFLSLYLRHSLFSNLFVALPTSQLILQLVRCFTYVAAHSPTLLSLLVTGSSLTSHGEPPMVLRSKSRSTLPFIFTSRHGFFSQPSNL